MAPTLVLWAARDDLADLFGDPLAIWRRWARSVDGWAIDAGHNVAEEAPVELAAALTSFLAPQRHRAPMV
jgi:haloacetate dehalogenase